MAIGAALFGVFVLLLVALGSAVEAAMILATVPIAFVGGILALLVAGETWNVSSLVGLIGLFGIAVQNSLVLVTQTRGLMAEGRSLADAVREASIGRVRPKLMTAGTATLGLLPLLVLRLHGTEIERPLAVVMIGGLVTSTLFTLLVLPTFYLQVARPAGTQGQQNPEGGGVSTLRLRSLRMSAHGHNHSATPSTKRRLTAALALAAAYLVAEVIGGLWSGSLALLADAGHMLTDVGGLGLALLALRFSERPATPDRTYGYYPRRDPGGPGECGRAGVDLYVWTLTSGTTR